MEFDYNSFIHQYLFVMQLGVFLVAAGIASFEFQSKKTISLILLVLGALALRIFVSLIDPFLHLWDEQFHALVAKNMMINPFKPTLLIDPILSYDYKFWPSNHVWLHKQPLFLWQIALSFKLFGINEFTLRLPSLIMSAIMVFFTYRIGYISFNKRAGFYAAVLFTGSNFLIELASGRINTDHNDIAFLFYITASIWAWFEYSKSKRKYWILVIGLFSGFAILVKWLTGLLVYSGWFISIIAIKKSREQRQNYMALLKSLIITIIVALPWQIYILIRFPKESAYEFGLNSRHFFKAVEAHGGNWLFHFDKIKDIYGVNFEYLIYSSIFIFLFIKVKKKFKIAILTWILAVFIFFSIAATKMIAFTIIVSPLVYVIIGIVMAFLFDSFKNQFANQSLKRWLPSILSLVITFFLFFNFLNHEKLTLQNTQKRKKVYQNKIKEVIVFKELKSLLPDDNFIIFNTRDTEYVKIIFYTNYRSRKEIPSKENIINLKKQNINIAVFDNKKLPDYILNDKEIIKIKSTIWDKSLPLKPTIY